MLKAASAGTFLRSMLSSHMLSTTASRELFCHYLEQIAKLQQIQLWYTKPALSYSSDWCGCSTGATQYWSSRKHCTYYGVGYTAEESGAVALRETQHFNTPSLFCIHTEASWQGGEQTVLCHTEETVVATKFSKAGQVDQDSRGFTKNPRLCTCSFPTKGSSRLLYDHFFTGEQEITAMYVKIKSSWTWKIAECIFIAWEIFWQFIGSYCPSCCHCHQPRASSQFLIQNICAFKHLIKSSCLSQWENTYGKYFTQ